jgi:hypothetical protein
MGKEEIIRELDRGITSENPNVLAGIVARILEHHESNMDDKDLCRMFYRHGFFSGFKNPSMGDLAEIFEKSKSTIHSWLKGE